MQGSSKAHAIHLWKIRTCSTLCNEFARASGYCVHHARARDPLKHRHTHTHTLTRARAHTHTAKRPTSSAAKLNSRFACELVKICLRTRTIYYPKIKCVGYAAQGEKREKCACWTGVCVECARSRCPWSPVLEVPFDFGWTSLVQQGHCYEVK